MHAEIEETLLLLSRAAVRYLVVGGVAVVLHGFLRTTADLDVVIALDDENVERAVSALESAGFVPRAPVPLRDFADSRLRESWIEEKNMQVFSLWNPNLPGFELDLFVREPFDFEAVAVRASTIRIGGSVIAVVSVDDLIDMKERVGRTQDLEDVAALRSLKRSDDRS